MKRIVLLGCLIAVILMGSCNKKKFDYSQLESVHSEGQWKIPIGEISLTLESVLNQWAENDLVSADENGDLQISYRYAMDTVVIGSDFMTFGDFTNSVSMVLDNPYPYELEEPIDDVIHVEQVVSLDSDVLRLLSAKVRSGQFGFLMESTLGRIQKIIVKSPNIINVDGTLFERELLLDGVTLVDMAGVSLDAHEVNTLYFYYDIYYQAYDYTDPHISFDGTIDIRDLKIQELSGWLGPYPYSFRVDTSFTLPFANVDGAMEFADSRLTLSDRNTFNMTVDLRIDTAMVYGDDGALFNIFDSYPLNYSVDYTPYYTTFLDEHLNIDLNSDFNSILVSGELTLNPEGYGHEVTLTDTATIGFVAEGVLPIKLNIPDVTYNDTVDVNISDVEAPEIIKEVLLYLTFESEIPLNLMAQLYTTDEETGRVTDSLFVQPKEIKGSFDGTSKTTELTAYITNELLNHLLNTKHLVMRFNVNTEEQEVVLNMEDKIHLSLKADVFYDGDVDLR